jgi:hypothetical protein
VRFSAAECRPAPITEGSIILEVASSNCWYRGCASIQRSAGFSADPILINLHEVGAVEGTVSNTSELPVFLARIEIKAMNTPIEFTGLAPGDQAATDRDGRFWLRGLPPGDHVLTVFKQAYYPVRVPVRVDPKETSKVSIRLGEGEAIRGRFVGRYGLQMSELPGVLMRPATTGETELVAKPSWSPHGNTYGDFVFYGVPPGQYELRLVNGGASSRNQRFGWVPDRVVVTAPSADVTFEITHDASTYAPAFRVYDDRGSRIDAFDVVDCTIPGEYSYSFPNDRIGLSIARSCTFGRGWTGPPIVSGASFRWMILREGFQTVSGTERSFLKSSDSPVRVCDVHLVRGFSKLIQVFVQLTKEVVEPIGGVPVFADGTQVGSTSADGLLLVSLEFKPEDLCVRMPGYRGEVLPVNTNDPAGDLIQRVVLSRY